VSFGLAFVRLVLSLDPVWRTKGIAMAIKDRRVNGWAITVADLIDARPRFFVSFYQAGRVNPRRPVIKWANTEVPFFSL
jgi:hypothetical protein